MGHLLFKVVPHGDCLSLSGALDCDIIGRLVGTWLGHLRATGTLDLHAVIDVATGADMLVVVDVHLGGRAL